MKKVLSLLLAFVFLQANTWALSGGPVYAGDTASVKGTYAGTLIGKNTINTPTDPNNSTGANGLGIFAIGVPTTGPGVGAFAFFSQGDTFFGTIVGIIDPDLLTLNALVNGNTVVQNVGGNNGSSTSGTPAGSAHGQIVAKLVRPERSAFVSSNQGFRVEGNAYMDIQFLVDDGNGGSVVMSFGTVDLSVVGFQQSTDVDTSISFSSTGTGS